jgi:hypothetical protein
MAVFADATPYFSPLGQLLLTFVASIFPAAAVPYLLQILAITFLIFNCTMLLSLLHRLTSNLTVATICTLAFALNPLQWSVTLWPQFMPIQIAFFFGLAACIYLLAAEQQQDGIRVRYLLATFSFLIGLLFHPAILMLVPMPAIALVWQKRWIDTLRPLLLLGGWILLCFGWLAVSQQPGIAWSAQNIFDHQIFFGLPSFFALGTLGLLMALTAGAALWRRDRYLGSLGMMLLLLGLSCFPVLPDPLLGLNELPPAYGIIVLFTAIAVVARLLAKLPWPVLRTSAALVVFSFCFTQFVRAYNQDIFFPDKINRVFLSDNKVDWMQLLDSNPEIWQLSWQLGEITESTSESMHYYKAAHLLAPKQPLPRLGIVQALLKQRRFKEAESLARLSVDEFMGDPVWGAMFSGKLGIALVYQKRWQEALTYLEGALPWLQNDRSTLRALVSAYQGIGNRKRAMRAAIRLRRLEM